jgi:multisubunit Na+/H+ antiporter MnhB subunit
MTFASMTFASMTFALALEIVLAAVVLTGAVWAITARGTLPAVAGFVAYGLLLSLVWVRLGAPDVALTEAAIGSGLTGALLVGAAARLRLSEVPMAVERPGVILRVLAAVLSVAVAAALAVGVLLLPDPAPTLAPAAAENAAATSLGNPVTNVLMAFRALDTLLEKIVLLLALIGVWSLAPDRFWGGRPGPRHHADPYGVLAFVARVLPPVGIIVGIYILWTSADNPGGAFQGGTILAAMWLLVMMAGLADAPPVSERRLRLLLLVGPVVFLIVGLGGLAFGDAFLAYPMAYAKALILIIEFAMILTIAVTLGLLVAGPPEREPGS